jgi:hypothetical protein
LNPAHRNVVAAFAAHREVVMLALSIHVNGEAQVLARLEQMQLFFQQERIGAQVDVLLSRYQALNDLANLRMHQRFAARNGHHRSATLVNRLEAFFRCQLTL